MPLDYLLNLMSFLERRAAEFFLRGAMIELAEDLAGEERPPAVPRAREFDNPTEWLRATPLMQALATAAEELTGAADTEEDDEAPPRYGVPRFRPPTPLDQAVCLPATCNQPGFGALLANDPGQSGTGLERRE